MCETHAVRHILDNYWFGANYRTIKTGFTKALGKMVLSQKEMLLEKSVQF